MELYPSINRATGQNYIEIPNAYIWDKIDGSQIRVSYSKKQGFHLFGTKKTLFDKTDKIFGEAIEVFLNTLAEPLTEVLRNNKWDKAVVFAEFCGKKSIAASYSRRPKNFNTI